MLLKKFLVMILLRHVCSGLSEGPTKGSDSHNHPFIPGSPYPQHHYLKIGCLLCNFLICQLLKVPRNSNVDHCFKSIEFVTILLLFYALCFSFFFFFGHGAYEILAP